MPAFHTSIAFDDPERAKNKQSSMRVRAKGLDSRASGFAEETFASAYKEGGELVVAGFWFPTRGEKVTCDVLDVFLLLCPNGASVALTNAEEKEEGENGKALRKLHEEMLARNKSAVVILPNERELHIVAVRKDMMRDKEEKEKKGINASVAAGKKIDVGFYEDDENDRDAKKKEEKEEDAPASTSSSSSSSSSYFLGFEIPSKSVFEANLLLENSQFVVILDLDETLLQAASEGTLERASENERRKLIELDGKIETLSNANDENNRDELSKCRRERQETEQRRRFLVEDYRMLKEFREGNAVRQGALLNAKNEKALVVDKLNPKNELKMVERPVVRLASKYRGGLNGFTMFTRIDPDDPNSSIIVHVRPGWFGPHGLKEALSGINRSSKKRLAEVYVCTTAEKEYAMEMWRILDGDFSLIDEQDVRRRVVSLYGLGSGARKSFKMAWEGNANKWPHALSLIIDDRSNVWAETEQPHVLTVHPFLPNGYIEPESNSIEKNADAANSNNDSNTNSVKPAAVVRRERETFLERELPGKGGVLGSALGMLNAARTRWFYEFQKYRKEKRLRMFEESFESSPSDDNDKVESEKEEIQTPASENATAGGDGAFLPSSAQKKNTSLELPSLNKILPEIMAKEAQELASALKARAGVSRTATGAGSALDSILAPLHRSMAENEKIKKEKREKEEREKREQMQREKEERERKEREEREVEEARQKVEEARQKAEREAAEEARWKEERARRLKEREEDEVEEQERKEKRRNLGSAKKLDKDGIHDLNTAGKILQDAKREERAAEAALKKAKKEQQQMLKELEVEKKRKASAEKRKATREVKNGSASKRKKEVVSLTLDEEMAPEAWNATLDEIACKVCKSKDEGEKMLLCDGCDCGFHIYCLKPPMKKIPEGDDDWFCKTCKVGVERMTKSVEAKVALRVAMQELPESYQEEAIKICKVAHGLEEDADEEIVIDVAELEPKTLWRLNLVCERAKDDQL